MVACDTKSHSSTRYTYMYPVLVARLLTAGCFSIASCPCSPIPYFNVTCGKKGRVWAIKFWMMSHGRDLNFLVTHLLSTYTLWIDYVGYPKLVYKISEEHTPYTKASFKCHPTIVTSFEGWINLLCMCGDTIVYFACISPLSSKVRGTIER